MNISMEIMRRNGVAVDAGGPAHGNQRSEWDTGARFDFPNPEHR